jgi:hypothetical protein
MNSLANLFLTMFLWVSSAVSVFTAIFLGFPLTTNTSASLFLMMFLWVLSVGVFGVQLLQVELLRLIPNDGHLGELVLGPKLLASDLTSLSA